MTEQKKDLSPIENLQPNEKSLTSMIDLYKDRMMTRASDDLRLATPEKQDQFLARLIASILKNENLRECFNSAQGRVSIYMLIDECLKTGLELDKHAYAIPYAKKIKNSTGNETWVKEASFQIKRQGFHALLCGGSKPIFKDLLWGVVYEKEKDHVVINRATGNVDHPICIDSDRGKPVGVWVQATRLDNSKEVEFFPINFIYGIRDNHSKTYQDYLIKIEEYKAKKITYKPLCVWITDEIPMIEKTAIKAFCRPYADVKEELANAYYADRDEVIPEKFDPVDISEKLIDAGIENLENTEPEFGNVPETPEEPTKKKNETLF